MKTIVTLLKVIHSMESFSLNPLKRRQQLGISNTYFTNKNAEYPPSPTDQG